MQAYRKALALRMRRLFATSAWMSREIPAEIAFLSDYGVPEPVLSYAATLARRQQTDALDVLLSEGLVEEDVYYRALAQHIGAPFLTQFEIDAGAEHEFATKRGYARLGSNPEGLEWLFAPEGATLRRLLGLAKNGRLRKIFGVTTRRRFLEAIEWERLHRAALAAPYTVERKFPEICARRALLGPSLLWAIVLNAVALTLLFAPNPMLALASALPLSGLFFLSVFLRLFACAASHEAVTSTPRLGDAELPRYTLVVPLYREARVASQLARAIDKLDYPRAKLDVIFVVEREDRETAAALREHAPRAPHRILAAPDGEPKTKPRALNIAKDFAEGALLAVYDAEDLPEPGQLREAASLFATLPSQVACLQAMLAIDNGDRNLLTAHFALDYAALFEVFNRGLGEMETPIFLGGTSNHFRFEALEAVGFWDAYNVTEDADLGLRLARAGYLVKTFRSRTFEEAPVTLKALFFQRTRWLKGWMQTALAHCRAPRGLFDDLGPRRTLAALGMFTGGFAAPLLGPWLALVFLYRAVFGNLLAPQTWSELVLSTLWCSLTLFGAVAVIWPLLLGMRRAELTRLWPALLATPLWHLMLSAAAWRALYELWDKPHHWRKTDHGGVWRREAPALRRTANS
jgi:cellulose synthase/poly-beta-1,6-N-acetylglucosamine synthase-like glycosyltransferase